MTSPFIAASELAELLTGPTPPAVLDASLNLLTPAFDGDYRLEPQREHWVQERIPGAVYVNVAEDFSDTTAPWHYTHPEPQAIADELARLGIAKDRPVVVYDNTGTMFAARLWYLLRWIGHDVRLLDGGLPAWLVGGHPVASGEEAAPEPVAPWPAKAERPAWVSKEELVELGTTVPLVCGLPRSAWTGEAASRYARRGRIPGSLNVSSRDLFTKEGTVRSRVELILAYEQGGVPIGEGEVLLYCGGGISAAANAITLAAIGHDAVRIYDGSLEEWAADPGLPMEVGEPTSV